MICVVLENKGSFFFWVAKELKLSKFIVDLFLKQLESSIYKLQLLFTLVLLFLLSIII